MTKPAAPPLTGLRRDPSAGRSKLAISGSTRVENDFVNAQRHSRRVRALKIVLPVIGVVIAAGFTGYSYLITPPKVSVDVTGTAIKDGKLVMANPRLDGFTKENLPYSMTAIRAIQDMKDGGVIALEQIDATFPVNEKNSATVDAPSGLYDREKNTLDITDEMTVTTTDGMVAQFKSAFLDIGKGVLKTTEPVDIRTAGSHISADSMTLSEGGKVMVFENRVRMQIDRESMMAAKGGDEGTDVQN